eukprot:6283569-Amphidinium_carterae.1
MNLRGPVSAMPKRNANERMFCCHGRTVNSGRMPGQSHTLALEGTTSSPRRSLSLPVKCRTLWGGEVGLSIHEPL